MSTTTPDNLYSPDSDSAYALVQDLGAMQDSVQSALVKRGNMYIGTAYERGQFTSAPEGVHWQDTDGTKFEYVRQGGSWVALPLPTLETKTIQLDSGFTSSSNNPTMAWKLGYHVTLSVAATGSFSNTTYQKVGSVPSGWEPEYTVRAGAMGSGMKGYCGAQVSARGAISLGWSDGGVGLSAPSWIQANVSYYILP